MGFFKKMFDDEAKEYKRTQLEQGEIPLEEKVNINSHLKEIAYHEAGHFLFNCLVQKENFGFLETESIIISVNKNEIRGTVVKPIEFSNEKEREHFYSDDVNRVAYNSLNYCAGYATYLKFFKIENREYYIGDFDKEKSIFYRYNLKNCPLFDETFDYAKIYTYLKYYGITNKTKLYELIEFLNLELIGFMSLGGISSAIGFIKNEFIRNNNKKINSEKVKSIARQVNQHTRRITLSKLIAKARVKILELKEEM